MTPFLSIFCDFHLLYHQELPAANVRISSIALFINRKNLLGLHFVENYAVWLHEARPMHYKQTAK